MSLAGQSQRNCEGGKDGRAFSEEINTEVYTRIQAHPTVCSFACPSFDKIRKSIPLFAFLRAPPL